MRKPASGDFWRSSSNLGGQSLEDRHYFENRFSILIRLAQDCGISIAMDGLELVSSGDATVLYQLFNTLRPRQNGRHFADETFNCIFVNENVRILIKFSLKFVPKGPINNIPALVQIMAWRQACMPGSAWWHHQMGTFSALLAFCAGNSPVSGEFPVQSPLTRSFDVFFDLRLNKRLSKQSWGWWFETLACPLWCHCNCSVWKSLSSMGKGFYYPCKCSVAKW